MDIHKFEVLLTAINTGSLSKAAVELGYTQSAVSHSINSLEKESGVLLLMRDRSGVHLTSAGRVLLPYIRNTVNAFYEYQNRIADLHSLEVGDIVIGTYTSVAVHWLPDIINSFQEQHPAIHFHVKQGNYAQIAQWIKDGIIDCGFTITPNIRGLVNVLLFEDRLFVIYPPQHPIGQLNNIKPENLSGYPFIMVEEGDDPIIFNFFSDRNINLDVRYQVVDDYAVVAMVESNLGISVCPELFFKRLPFNVKHKPLDTDYRRKISISYKKNYTLSPAVGKFIDHVQSWVKNNVYPLGDNQSYI